jgi:hypothetical protein
VYQNNEMAAILVYGTNISYCFTTPLGPPITWVETIYTVEPVLSGDPLGFRNWTSLSLIHSISKIALKVLSKGWSQRNISTVRNDNTFCQHFLYIIYRVYKKNETFRNQAYC